jgi:hypothetical protein
MASSFPTVVCYVVDTPRCAAPQTFMSNMLQAVSILYKTRLPLLLVRLPPLPPMYRCRTCSAAAAVGLCLRAQRGRDAAAAALPAGTRGRPTTVAAWGAGFQQDGRAGAHFCRGLDGRL